MNALDVLRMPGLLFYCLIHILSVVRFVTILFYGQTIHFGYYLSLPVHKMVQVKHVGLVLSYS